MELNKIYNEDCLETLSRMQDNSVDLIVTSPPYNKGFYAPKNARQSDVWNSLNGRKIAYDTFNDDMLPEKYEAWQRNVLTECLRVLKPTGSIFYNHKDVIYNGLITPPKWVYDFPLRQQIIWDRQSSCMIDPHYFMPANEWIYWIVKDPKQVYFDKSKSIFRTNIWRMNAESNPHPAPFPKKLVGNVILCCTKEGYIVYDPFMGSGTTALVASQEKRNYIGSEISKQYCEMAEKRIYEQSRQLTLF